MYELLAVLVGVCAGTLTGLIPGIHVNLVSVIVLSAAAVLIAHVGVVAVVVFIIAMAVTHTFIDVLPSIFLGAPDAAMALSVLPGHKLLHEGRGIEAVRLTQVGSLAAVILSTGLFIGFVALIKSIQSFLELVPFVLLGLVLFLLLQEFRVQTIILFVLAGVLGVLTFRLSGLENPLFPLLTGLFGISTLVLSMSNSSFQEQKTRSFVIPDKMLMRTLLVGQSVGFVAAFMPGLGAASAAALAEPFVKAKEEGFLLLVGTISTVNFVLSLVTFYVLDKARNGAVVAVKELVEPTTALIVAGVGSVLIAGGLASVILTKLTPLSARLFKKIDYVHLVKIIIITLVTLTYLLSGWRGFLILVPAVALGVLAPKIGVPRRFLMGCLLIPVLTYFF